jgi:hypothetical protein
LIRRRYYTPMVRDRLMTQKVVSSLETISTSNYPT